MRYAPSFVIRGASKSLIKVSEITVKRKNIYPALALLLAIMPVIGSAQLLQGIKEGAGKAVQAVGTATGNAVEAAGTVAGKATDAVKDTVDSSQQSLRDEATPEATRAKLDAMAAETLIHLFAEQPGSRALFDRSAGYAVFDKREASFYVVAGYGRGVAVDPRTGNRVYMKMATSGAGFSFGLGGFASQMVMLFEDAASFHEFVSRGLDAAAQVGTMMGEEREELALRFTDGKAIFILTGKGWKVSAKLTGSRYWPDEALNSR